MSTDPSVKGNICQLPFQYNDHKTHADVTIWHQPLDNFATVCLLVPSLTPPLFPLSDPLLLRSLTWKRKERKKERCDWHTKKKWIDKYQLWREKKSKFSYSSPFLKFLPRPYKLQTEVRAGKQYRQLIWSTEKKRLLQKLPKFII